LAHLRGEGRLSGLKYISWADSTGYAVAGKSYVKALVDAGVNLTWVPMLPGKGGYEPQTVRAWSCAKLSSVCNRPLDYDTVLIHTVPEYYSYWIDSEKRKGCRVFGYTVWELERLPNHWPEILNRLVSRSGSSACKEDGKQHEMAGHLLANCRPYFENATLARLVDFTMVPVHEPTWSGSYKPSDQWADPSTDHAARHMREVFEQQQSALERARILSERINREFSRQAVVESFLKALK
jgi:hypothetical protein